MMNVSGASKPIVKSEEVLDNSIVQHLFFSFAQAILGQKD